MTRVPLTFFAVFAFFTLAGCFQREQPPQPDPTGTEPPAVVTTLSAQPSVPMVPSSFRGGAMPLPMGSVGSLPSSANATLATPAGGGLLEGTMSEQTPRPVGGPWVTCYAHFRPMSTPLRDVTRLALLCGPANGMRAIDPAVEGYVEEGGVAQAHAFPLREGECIRVFAIAEASLPKLELVLLGPTGDALAQERAHDRWPIVQADRPFCVVETGIYKVRVRARKGRGQYALQAWRLLLKDLSRLRPNALRSRSTHVYDSCWPAFPTGRCHPLRNKVRSA